MLDALLDSCFPVLEYYSERAEQLEDQILEHATTDLTDTYMTSVSSRMNKIMKVLTMIGTIFIPLTFLAGVYGMNFRYLPELNHVWRYPVFWIICIIVAILMVLFFRHQHWL